MNNVKKLESLNTSKFKAFEGNAVQNQLQIVGGTVYTTYVSKGGAACDQITDATQKHTSSAGRKYDNICSSVNSRSTLNSSSV